MDKPVDIKGAKYKPAPGVIEQLETMLEKAKAGYIYSIIIVAEDRDGCLSYGRSIDYRNTLRIVGGLEMVKNQLLSSHIEDVPSEVTPE